jgi:calcineurin-like phosphoesterase family protein
MIYFVSDTHFGHKMLVDKGFRSEGFENQIIKNWNYSVQPTDTVIHLGDFCLGRYKHYSLKNSVLMWRNQLNGNIVLVKGNHDKYSCTNYLNLGFIFCCNKFSMTINGQKIICTHEPVLTKGNAINIHGHLHNDNHRLTGELAWYKHDGPQHFNASVDANDFRAKPINTIMSIMTKKRKRLT